MNRVRKTHPMLTAKSDIISRLKKEILPLEGLGSNRPKMAMGLGLDFMTEAFPQGHFPLGAVHELISMGAEATASMVGFTSAILSGLMKTGGPAVWIGQAPILFPPALKAFGIQPDQVMVINLKKEKDILWAMEESLKCPALSAVIGELPELSFTHSRRFQLAVEQSKTTGFILHSNTGSPNACIARWNIKPLPSFSDEELPGIVHPRWQIDLLKIRNGKPHSWMVEWVNGRFRHLSDSIPSIQFQPKRKTG
jgi:protein ImuA